MLTGSNLLHTKQFNLRIVHEVIRLHGPISRAEIARRTELTGQTISNLARELMSYGLVSEAERRHEGRGAPSTALTINPDGAFSIGLDFNRDHLTGVLVDLAGTVRQREHVDVELTTPAQALDLMAEVAGRLTARQGLGAESVWGVGVGIPGPMHQASGGDGYVVTDQAFAGWHDVPLADLLNERLDIPVFLENNATAAAIGERWYGAGRQFNTFFYLFFGSGLGGGMVMNGLPYKGLTGNAGELGYIPTTLAGRSGGVSDSSHAGYYFNLPRLFEALRAGGAPARVPDDLAACLDGGHPILVDWLDAAADHLTGLVLAVEYLLDPEAIFFGGRLPDNVLAALLARVGERIPGRRISGKSAEPHHLIATAGVDSAALGVATLPIYEFFAPTPQLLLKRRRRPASNALSAAWTMAVS